MSELTGSYDVLVAGGGNAALCAAITAREAGASVLLVEHAPRAFRGGNSRHTRNFRIMHAAPTATLTEAYAEDEYWDDLRRVTDGETDEALARLTIRSSGPALAWMESRGVRFQPSLTGTLSLSRTNAFFLGGGKALLNAYYRAAERLGVVIVYDAEVQDVRLRAGAVDSVVIESGGRTMRPRVKTVVVAAGGFQANIDWLRQYWGAAADNFLIRGTPYAKGRVLRNLLDQDVMPIGDPTQCHAVAIDARAPKFDGGIVTRLDVIPFSIVVNREARRFYDEGEDLWPKRYAIWGRLIAQQPDQIAYAITDAKALTLFMPSMYPAITGATIDEIAGKLALDRATLGETVRAYNAAVRPGRFSDKILDDCRTDGLAPPKSHWAQRIDAPPYVAYPLRPGITFTYLGVKVDERARVVMRNGERAKNLFAAGEIMAGNILGRGYLAGFGMTIGTVFGCIAGREAATYARW
ncbi:MAG TPA: FAD-dependent tricarballylate dehydrogenase TcuA [Stellaceae bacterium]|nr:FAD-dependent tricarballylate dehydrogenase TcuA [Stellaceae bacterium]